MQASSPKAYQSFLSSHRPKHSDPDGSDYEAHGEVRARLRRRLRDGSDYDEHGEVT